MNQKSIVQFLVTIVLAGLLVGLVWDMLGVEPSQAAPPIRPLQAPGDCTVITTTDSGAGSLRQCMLGLQAGATITFSTSVFTTTSPATIALTSALPDIITNNVTIDGSNAGVILDGSGTSSGTSGLIIDGASNVVIKGLQILNFPSHGIELRNPASNNTIGGINGSPGGACSGECNLISGNGSDGINMDGSSTMSNTISGNYIGTDLNGTTALGNQSAAIYIGGGASYNLIGGGTPGERNLISGNNDGVSIRNNGTRYNTVSGNYIGADVSGAAALGNAGSGIYVDDGASYNLIGGDAPGEGNLISGNNSVGLIISGSGTDYNVVRGNYIGTDTSGTFAIGQGDDGMQIMFGASYNLIGGNNATPGGSCSGECNLISGNGIHGIRIKYDVMSNTVSGNYIGTDVSGTAAISNVKEGIQLGGGAAHNVIGGDTPGERNLISGNGITGVQLYGDSGYTTTHNTVIGNFIGTDVSGTTALGNGSWGVGMGTGSGGRTMYNFVGGDTAADRNLISGNAGNGVTIESSGAMSNTVSGNYIGVDVNGATALSNTGHGVYISEGGQYNIIGGDTPGERNIISGNADGIKVENSTTLYNTITQNSIFNNTNKGIELDDGGNQELSPPTLTDVSTNTVKGLAILNSTVEIFSDAENEGRYFHGSVIADASGNFTFTQAIAFTGTNVTATSTDSNGNTSEFSALYARDIYLPVLLKNN